MWRKTFSIRWLMVLVAAAAWAAWVYRSVYPHAFGPAMMYSGTVLLFAVGPWKAARGDRRLAGWILGIASAIEIGVLAYLGVFSLRYLSAVYKFMLSLVLLPLMIGAGVAWANLASAEGARRRVPGPAAWGLAVALTALPISMIASQWPLWAAFYVSRPALERLADRLEAGETLARPEWAGLFLVRKVSRVNVGPGNLPLVVANDETGHTWLIRTRTPVDVPGVGPDGPVNHRATILSYPIERGGRWWRHETD